ncbi:hypothetical protein PSEUDO9AZ_10555 [Pseudomonas sp. 9AZ]|nr:hypothetical protein PSEUDO9AZ_10555 [Pseudomonas sp. 9AZ]
MSASASAISSALASPLARRTLELFAGLALLPSTHPDGRYKIAFVI